MLGVGTFVYFQTFFSLCPFNWACQSLLQLAHHPTEDNGRGLSLLRTPSTLPGKVATDIARFQELVGKRNFSIKMDFKEHLQNQELFLLLLLLQLAHHPTKDSGRGQNYYYYCYYYYYYYHYYYFHYITIVVIQSYLTTITF